MPISGFKPSSSTILAQGRLTQAMVSQEVARSVIITFASGSQVTLTNAMITSSGPGSMQVTYQGGTTTTTPTTTNTSGKTTATDDWLA
jgi:uncharacterized protein (DUF2345 family)